MGKKTELMQTNHEIIERAKDAIFSKYPTKPASYEDLSLTKYWAAHAALVPDTTEASQLGITVAKFIDRHFAGEPQKFVYGLTVTDLTNDEFWKRILDSDRTAATARAQVTAMGEVIQQFLKETNLEEYVMKTYYGVDINVE